MKLKDFTVSPKIRASSFILGRGLVNREKTEIG